MNKEIWRKIDGFPDNIEVSNTGMLRELRYNSEPIYRKPYKSGNYYKVSVAGIQYPIHRLVAKAFISNYSDDCLVIHIDGDDKNNNANNLMCESKCDAMKSVAKLRGYDGNYIRIKGSDKIFATVASASYLLRIPRECIEDSISNQVPCFGYQFELSDITEESYKAVNYLGRSDVVALGREMTSVEEYDRYLKSII